MINDHETASSVSATHAPSAMPNDAAQVALLVGTPKLYSFEEADLLINEAHLGLAKMDLTEDELRLDRTTLGMAIVAHREHPFLAVNNDLLRHLAVHCGKHRATLIRNTFQNLSSDITTVTPTHLTEEHFEIYVAFDASYMDGKFYVDDTAQEINDYFAVRDYAFRHLEDRHLILYLVNDRGATNLRSVMDMLPALKEVESSSLLSGAL